MFDLKDHLTHLDHRILARDIFYQVREPHRLSILGGLGLRIDECRDQG